MTEPRILPRPPRTTNTRMRMDVLKSNLVAESCEKLPPKRAPAAPARAAETTKAIMRYSVTEMPTDSAAILLSRTAIMARPVRLRTRLSTITSATMTRMAPARKVEYVDTPEAPWAPLMMAVPSSSRCRSSIVELPVMLKITCRPRESTPTMRQVTISLMISPKASVTIAR